MLNLKKVLKNKGYSKIPLIISGTNHLEINASINGITGRFILDTGASNTCVGVDKANYFKLVSKDYFLNSLSTLSRKQNRYIHQLQNHIWNILCRK